MFEIKEVSKIYDLKNRKVVAVDNVSLSINVGDIFGIIGYSGAGKSTLVRMINQLERQDKGKILIDGHELNKLSPKQLRQLRTKIGMIFQHFNLLWSRTVSENIELALQIAGIKEKHKRQQRVKELVVSGSKALVASSHSKILGLLAKALAIPTLCFCPPDNSLG